MTTAKPPPTGSPGLRPRKGFPSAWRCTWLALALLGLCACKPLAPPPEDDRPDPPPEVLNPAGKTPVSVRGYNYTAEGVQEFYVENYRVSNLPPYGGGGKDSCCATLPNQWRKELTVRVDWTIGHYTRPWSERQHMSIDDEMKCCWTQRTLHQTAPIQPYARPDTLQVFFLPDDKVEVWAYEAGPQNPNHPSKRGYPIDPAASAPDPDPSQPK